MLNRNSSAGTAAQKSSKCSLIQRPTIILAMLLLCAVSCLNEKPVKKEPSIDLNEKPVKKEPSIELTQSELMVIYENGYLNGRINCQLHSTDGKSAEIWSIDSATMSKRFFK